VYRDAVAQIASAHPDSLIICMDAYDALCTHNEKKGKGGAFFTDIFRTFNKPVVLSVESECMANCSPLDEWFFEHDPLFEFGEKAAAAGGTARNGLPIKRYVNGGLLAGFATQVASVYDWMLTHNCVDDQVGLSLWARAHPDQWLPDVGEVLFSNKTYGEPLRSTEIALFTHFPGVAGWASTTKSYNRAAQTILGVERARHVSGGACTKQAYMSVTIVITCFLLFVLYCLRNPSFAVRRIQF
jgi:hypothetical protein